MNQAPLVSVIMPTHNRAQLLPRAMRSVLGQTHRNLELIVVDDASTDATREVVAGFGDPRVRYHRLATNQRAGAARNAGIQLARAELVAFQDDDDQWLCEKLEKQVAFMQNAPEVGLCICGLITVRADGARYWGGSRDFASLTFANGMDFATGLVATPAWLARRSALLQAGLFDERMKAWDDWEYAVRLAGVCRFGHLDEPLLIQERALGVTMWNNERNFSNDMQIIMERHAARWAGKPEVLSRHCLIIGRSESLFHSPAAGRRWLVQALRHDPLNLSALLWLAASVLSPATIAKARSAWRRIRAAGLP